MYDKKLKTSNLKIKKNKKLKTSLFLNKAKSQIIRKKWIRQKANGKKFFAFSQTLLVTSLTWSLPPLLNAFFDAYYIGCLGNKCSTGVFCVYLSKNLFPQSFQNQPTVARSITKVKYKAIVNTATELLSIQSL